MAAKWLSSTSLVYKCDSCKLKLPNLVMLQYYYDGTMRLAPHSDRTTSLIYTYA